MEEAVRRYSDMVYHLAFLNTQNKFDAEDVFQEIFLKLFQYKESIQSEVKASLFYYFVGYRDKTIGRLYGRCRSSINRRRNVALKQLLIQKGGPGSDFGGVFKVPLLHKRSFNSIKNLTDWPLKSYIHFGITFCEKSRKICNKYFIYELYCDILYK